MLSQEHFNGYVTTTLNNTFANNFETNGAPYVSPFFIAVVKPISELHHLARLCEIMTRNQQHTCSRMPKVQSNGTPLYGYLVIKDIFLSRLGTANAFSLNSTLFTDNL